MAKPWHNSADFRFTEVLEANYEAIRDEALTLPFYAHRQSPEGSHEYKITKQVWQVFDLNTWRNPIYPNQHLAPVTTGLLEQFPEIMGCRNGRIYFSLIGPRAIVTPHFSGVKHRVRHQLCLVKPKGEGDAFIRVAGIKRGWDEGKLISFDDSFRHDVQNNTDEERMVLLFDSIDPEAAPGVNEFPKPLA